MRTHRKSDADELSSIEYLVLDDLRDGRTVGEIARQTVREQGSYRKTLDIIITLRARRHLVEYVSGEGEDARYRVSS